jgi:hypothetical protein
MRSVIVSVGVTGHCLDDNTPGAARGSRLYALTHAAGQDIFLLDWRQVLSYDVSFLNIRIVVNSVINLVNMNLPRTALQICMFHFNLNPPPPGGTAILPEYIHYYG